MRVHDHVTDLKTGHPARVVAFNGEHNEAVVEFADGSRSTRMTNELRATGHDAGAADNKGNGGSHHPLKHAPRCKTCGYTYPLSGDVRAHHELAVEVSFGVGDTVVSANPQSTLRARVVSMAQDHKTMAIEFLSGPRTGERLTTVRVEYWKRQDTHYTHAADRR